MHNREKLSGLMYFAMACGIAICAMGVFLVYISSDQFSESKISFLGIMEVNTGNIGVAIIALGAGLTAYLIRALVSKWR